MEARRAHPARVKCVPEMPAVTRPSVFLARRPTAQWAADAWAGWFVALVLFGFTINNNGGLVLRDGTHASIL
jgi:hypothetical protein